MHKQNEQQISMFRRVIRFGAERAEIFTNNSLGGRTFGAVATATNRAQELIASQAGGRSAARRSTASKAAARKGLLHLLEAIRRTAVAIALDTPGVDLQFRIPRDQRDEAFLGTARSF